MTPQRHAWARFLLPQQIERHSFRQQARRCAHVEAQSAQSYGFFRSRETDVEEIRPTPLRPFRLPSALPFLGLGLARMLSKTRCRNMKDRCMQRSAAPLNSWRRFLSARLDRRGRGKRMRHAAPRRLAGRNSHAPKGARCWSSRKQRAWRSEDYAQGESIAHLGGKKASDAS